MPLFEQLPTSERSEFLEEYLVEIGVMQRSRPGHPTQYIASADRLGTFDISPIDASGAKWIAEADPKSYPGIEQWGVCSKCGRELSLAEGGVALRYGFIDEEREQYHCLQFCSTECTFEYHFEPKRPAYPWQPLVDRRYEDEAARLRPQTEPIAYDPATGTIFANNASSVGIGTSATFDLTEGPEEDVADETEPWEENEEEQEDDE